MDDTTFARWLATTLDPMKLFKSKAPRRRQGPAFDYENARKYDIVDPPFDPPPFISLEAVIDPALAACAAEGRRAFRSKPRDKEPRSKFVIHPSSAGSGCKRKVFFDTVEPPTDEHATPDARLQRIFDVGHDGHERIQGYLFECWRQGRLWQVWEDVVVRIPGMRIKGELDAIVATNDTDRYLIEVKTASSKDYEKLTSPKSVWVVQAYIYMTAVNLRAAIILVECKDNQRIKEFFIEWDPATWHEIVTHLRESVFDVLDTEVLPPKNTDHCYFCNYQEVCESEQLDWDTIHDAMGS